MGKYLQGPMTRRNSHLEPSDGSCEIYSSNEDSLGDSRM